MAMQVTKIDISQIKNEEMLKLAEELEDDEILLIFNDGTYTKVSIDYNGIIKDYKTNKAISQIPIDTNWRPLSVGLRLYNGEVRLCRSMLMGDLSYILSYYKK